MITPHRVTILSLHGCGPDHSFTIRHCNKHAWCMLLLNSHFILSVVSAAVLSTLSRFASGGPLLAKRAIHGSHTWSGGTIYGNIICCRWSGGPVVAGDQLRCDKTTMQQQTINTTKTKNNAKPTGYKFVYKVFGKIDRKSVVLYKSKCK